MHALSLQADVSDRDGQPIDSDWVATRSQPVVEGLPGPDGHCDMAGISGPDNLDFVTGGGALLIAEDSDREPNRLWAWQDGSLVPLFAAQHRDEAGMAEVSGLSWVPGVVGPDGVARGWITLSLQHPGAIPAVVGLLGPVELPDPPSPVASPAESPADGADRRGG